MREVGCGDGEVISVVSVAVKLTLHTTAASATPKGPVDGPTAGGVTATGSRRHRCTQGTSWRPYSSWRDRNGLKEGVGVVAVGRRTVAEVQGGGVAREAVVGIVLRRGGTFECGLCVEKGKIHASRVFHLFHLLGRGSVTI